MPPIVESLRLHQWAKNLLLLVPPLLAHVLLQPAVLREALVAFLAFSVAASGNYVINDLLDREADRHHPAKRHRPLPSGRVGTGQALVLGPGLVLAGVATAFLACPRPFALMLVAYLVLALGYSVVFRRVLLVDVTVLAALYTIRLIAGGAATDVEVSSWLLVFSLFFFVSLSLAKRLTELDMTAAAGSDTKRAYLPADREAFVATGPAAGMLSILVLALYVSSEAIRARYTHPDLLWMLCPLLLYWVLRVWFFAIRGRLHHDPVVFALRDRASWAVLAGVLLVLFLATR